MPSTISDRLYGLTTSVAIKAPCRVATTAAITLSGTQTIDGVSVVAGDRVLVKDQASAVDNGIWVCGTGTWARAADFDGSFDTVQGTLVYVLAGSASASTYWEVTTSGTIVIGADSVAFEMRAFGALTRVQEFTATAGQTAFSLEFTPHAFSGVYKNGARLTSADYSTSGTSLLLVEGADEGDSIVVISSETAGRVPGVQTAATRTALGLITDRAEGMVAYLYEGVPSVYGRFGTFAWNSANLSAEVTSDAQQGLYVAPASDTTGTSGAWVRQWDGIHGKPEWFGAVVGDSSKAAANLTALNACEALCPVTVLRNGTYYINATWKVQTTARKVIGANQSIESPWNTGTQIFQTTLTADVIQIGNDTSSDIPANIQFENVTVGWDGNLTPPSSGNEIDAPKGFRVQHVLAAKLERCFAINPIIGFYFYGVINTRCVNYGVTRVVTYGGANDFFRGVWCRGTPALFAGGNASLFLQDGNVSLASAIRATLVSPRGVFADADFADVYVLGLETSQVAFPVYFDGTGSTSVGGHGDVHIRALVCDQCIGDGVTVINLNAVGKVQIDGGYIQLVQAAAGGNKGIRLEDNSGFTTIDSLQITGGTDNTSTIGIWAHNADNVSISPTCIIESVGFPVVFEEGSIGGKVMCSVGDGVATTGAGTRSAIGIEDCFEMVVQPNVRGAAGAWEQGVLLLDAGNNRITVDPTGIDIAACVGSKKTVVNAVNITAPGYYNPDGTSGASGAGIYVTGITA